MSRSAPPPKPPGDDASDADIRERCRSLPGFRGVFSKDELHRRFGKFTPGLYAINIQDAEGPNSGPGTHWCALQVTARGSKSPSCWMDPYGGPPPDTVVHFASLPSWPLHWTDDQVQGLSSGLCGAYTVEFLRGLAGGKRPEDVAASFTDSPGANGKRVSGGWLAPPPVLGGSLRVAPFSPRALIRAVSVPEDPSPLAAL